MALAVRQQADVVLRIHPATFPLETDAGQPFAVLRWLRQRGETARDWHGWCRWQGQRYRVRLIAAKLDPATARKARRRQRRKAQKAGRTITAPTLAGAGWLLVSHGSSRRAALGRATRRQDCDPPLRALSRRQNN